MDRAAVKQHVEKILSSQSFTGKGQLKKLLQVLFESMDSEVLLRPDRVIKELWPEEIRTKSSADVATEMARLRKALESYYSAEGSDDPITIHLPNRSVPGPDGGKEKRWIIAEARELGTPRPEPPAALAFEAPTPASQTAPLERITTPASITTHRGLKIVASLASVIILAVFSFLRLTADNRPQAARLDGATLRVVNAEGKELWSKSFPEGFWNDYYAEGLAPRLWFGDLEGRGHTSLLLLYHPGVNPRSRSTTLICYSDRGEEKWRWTPGRNLPELTGTPATFRTVGLGVLRPTDKTPARIVVSSWHDPQYPHQVAIVDRKGNTVSEYWHSGHLDHLTLADLDGDGREQIVATGISNGYRQATLIVLDPDRVFGASTEAARPELQLHGMGVAQERLRLLFPRSDLNTALAVYNEGQEAAIDHGRVRFSVAECLPLQPKLCQVWYEFDKNFRLLSVEADDQFRSTHAEFYLANSPKHPFTPEEQAAFEKIRCLVGCPSEFVSKLTQ